MVTRNFEDFTAALLKMMMYFPCISVFKRVYLFIKHEITDIIDLSFLCCHGYV